MAVMATNVQAWRVRTGSRGTYLASHGRTVLSRHVPAVMEWQGRTRLSRHA